MLDRVIGKQEREIDRPAITIPSRLICLESASLTADLGVRNQQKLSERPGVSWVIASARARKKFY